ncbi:guanine nucleotide binding protein, alpha subunit, partial [Favolaschia claudopus]
ITLSLFRSILETMPQLENHSHSNQSMRDIIRDIILQYPENTKIDVFPPGVAEAIRHLQRDPGLRDALDKLQHPGTAGYFLDSIERIAQADYSPSDEDIKHAQIEIKSIEETTLQMRREELTCRIWNLPAQSLDQQQWIRCFEPVQVLIFYVNLGDYDQFLYRDEDTNVLHKAFAVINSIANSQLFIAADVVLHVGSDKFAEKLKQIPLSNFFPDYTGGPEYDAACNYLKHQFGSL